MSSMVVRHNLLRLDTQKASTTSAWMAEMRLWLSLLLQLSMALIIRIKWVGRRQSLALYTVLEEIAAACHRHTLHINKLHHNYRLLTRITMLLRINLSFVKASMAMLALRTLDHYIILQSTLAFLDIQAVLVEEEVQPAVLPHSTTAQSSRVSLPPVLPPSFLFQSRMAKLLPVRTSLFLRTILLLYILILLLLRILVLDAMRASDAQDTTRTMSVSTLSAKPYKDHRIILLILMSRRRTLESPSQTRKKVSKCRTKARRAGCRICSEAIITTARITRPLLLRLINLNITLSSNLSFILQAMRLLLPQQAYLTFRLLRIADQA